MPCHEWASWRTCLRPLHCAFSVVVATLFIGQMEGGYGLVCCSFLWGSVEEPLLIIFQMLTEVWCGTWALPLLCLCSASHCPLSAHLGGTSDPKNFCSVVSVSSQGFLSCPKYQLPKLLCLALGSPTSAPCILSLAAPQVTAVMAVMGQKMSHCAH